MGKKGKLEGNLLDKMKHLSLNVSSAPLNPLPEQCQDPSLTVPSSHLQPRQLPDQEPSSDQPSRPEDIRKVYAWFQFVKKLPKLPPSLVIKLKSDEHEYLDLQSIDMSQINLYDIDKTDFTEIIDLEPLEQKTGFGYRFSMTILFKKIN